MAFDSVCRFMVDISIRKRALLGIFVTLLCIQSLYLSQAAEGKHRPTPSDIEKILLDNF